MRRLAEMHRNDPNHFKAKNVDTDVLYTAVEDSKPNALRRLHQFLLEKGDEKSTKETYEHAFHLGQPRYPKYAVLAGKHFRKTKQKRRAVRSIRNAIHANYPPAHYNLGRMWTKTGYRNFDQGIALFKQGAKLGNKSCIKALDAFKVGSSQ